MKKHITTILLMIMFLIGLGVMLYPAISDYWNSRVQSRVIANYESEIENMEDADYEGFFDEAEGYNAQIRQISFPLMNDNQVEGYEDILNVDGTGIIGYLKIEKLHVELPIYHGTSPAVLNMAVGHLQGSSLPIGGKSTHAVLSAHRGLPSAKLFSDLDQLEPGDTFTVTVLDRILTYQVDQIRIVLPSEVEDLYVAEGKDYCTLVTCTPYGINTHRLLVRGERVDRQQILGSVTVADEAPPIDPVIVAPIVAAPMLLWLLIALLLKYRKRS